MIGKKTIILESAKIVLAVVIAIYIGGCGTDKDDPPPEEVAVELPEAAVEPQEVMIKEPVSLQGIWVYQSTSNCQYFLDIGKTTYKDGLICDYGDNALQAYRVYSYEISENSMLAVIKLDECNPENIGSPMITAFARDGDNLTTALHEWKLVDSLPEAEFYCP